MSVTRPQIRSSDEAAPGDADGPGFSISSGAGGATAKFNRLFTSRSHIGRSTNSALQIQGGDQVRSPRCRNTPLDSIPRREGHDGGIDLGRPLGERDHAACRKYRDDRDLNSRVITGPRNGEPRGAVRRGRRSLSADGDVPRARVVLIIHGLTFVLRYTSRVYNRYSSPQREVSSWESCSLGRETRRRKKK